MKNRAKRIIPKRAHDTEHQRALWKSYRALRDLSYTHVTWAEDGKSFFVYLDEITEKNITLREYDWIKVFKKIKEGKLFIKSIFLSSVLGDWWYIFDGVQHLDYGCFYHDFIHIRCYPRQIWVAKSLYQDDSDVYAGVRMSMFFQHELYKKLCREYPVLSMLTIPESIVEDEKVVKADFKSEKILALELKNL